MGSPQDVVVAFFFNAGTFRRASLYFVETNCCQRERKCRPGCQLAENPSNKTIPKEAWDIVGKLIHEKISAAGLSEAWIQQYVNKKYENITKERGAAFKKAV